MPEEARNPKAGAQREAAPQAGTFRERKMQALAAESGGREAEPEARQQQPSEDLDPRQRTPDLEDGSAKDVGQDTQEGLYADENDNEYEEDEDLDPNDGTPGESEPDAELDESTWEKRYKDLQRETQTIRETRGDMEQEHAESMSQHLKLRFDLEDQLNEAVTRAEFLRNTMEGNAQRFQNINWANVPPEQVQAVQAQAQQAFMMQQQASSAYEQVQEEANKAKAQVKQREAAIAKTRLRRTIPNWGNETYAELREFATANGMPPAAFNDITDPVVIEWAYSAMQIKKAGSKGIQHRQAKRKAGAPKTRNPKRQSRDLKGRYAAARVEPNKRGSFAEKAALRLEMERKGR